MLFNWVQPLFNRYAQRCAKGVTRVRVDSQCPLKGAGIGRTPPRLCCVTQVNGFKLGHLACDLANAFSDVLVKSPTAVATETSGALR